MPGGAGASTGATVTGTAKGFTNAQGVYRPLMAGTSSTITASSPYGGGSGFSSMIMNMLPLFTMGIQGMGSLASGYSQSKAQKSLSDYEASVYESNARLADLKAADAIFRADKEAVKAKQASKRLIGSQRAALGAQGIDIESGSALDIQEESASIGAEEALNIRNNAWRESWGYKTQAVDLRGRAEMARITGKNTSRNTMLTGGLSAIKDVTYGMYLAKNKSAFSLSDYLSGVS